MRQPDQQETHSLRYGAAARQESRLLLRAFLERAEITGTCAQDAVITLGELVANGLDHGTARPDGALDLTWGISGGELFIAVHDGGSRSTPHVVRAAPEDPRGRGLMMVDALANSWEVARSDGTRVTVHITLSAAPATAVPAG